MPTPSNTAAPGYLAAGTKDKLLKRLTRAEGQIRGISRMVAADTYCIDVLTQISAAQAALDKVALEMLRSHAHHCMTAADSAAQPGGPESDIIAKTDELVNAISRLMAR